MGNFGPEGAADSEHGQTVPSLVEAAALDLAIDADDFFEMSLDNLCVAGLDGYLKRVNPSWTRTLGWTAEELMARPSVDFVHPEDREATLAGRERLRNGAPLGNHTNRYLCKDGTYRWFEWRSIAHDGRGLVYAAARDITEQKASEARLREAKQVEEKLQAQLLVADRMASIGTLAAGVAHEINNPLATVAANVSLIIEELRRLGPASPPGRVKELLEMALDARAGAERIKTIVGGLDTFSRIEAEHRAVIDIRPVLELAIDMANSAIRGRARLVRDYGAIPLVDADRTRLAQVFINLLINAAQALTERESATNEIRVVTSTDAGGRAMVEVRDTGPAIPASVLHRVFDPFFTTKPVGIGTGLGPLRVSQHRERDGRTDHGGQRCRTRDQLPRRAPRGPRHTRPRSTLAGSTAESGHLGRRAGRG
jgi:PAS domain S-box-containing protein